ncbi:MAG: triose-phosphate isomerase [Candidatus Vogelbacteria bacterium]|nr:triose-phosphate isomerase [Candidatus Vogelbacteria bacterium]
MARSRLIVANWKLNPTTLAEAKRLALAAKAASAKAKKVQVVLCPPAVYLATLLTAPGKLLFGAQDTFTEFEGAFTGEISPLQLRDLGVKYVIVGHSERRKRGDTLEVIAAKTRAVLKTNLAPIICIGEDKRDGDGDYLEGLVRELEFILDKVPRQAAKRIVLAYEPRWAIGALATGADTPEQFLHHAIFLRKTLVNLFGKEIGMSLPILYGGSVNVKNADSFLTVGQADGLLIGRESLQIKNLVEIIKLAAKAV